MPGTGRTLRAGILSLALWAGWMAAAAGAPPAHPTVIAISLKTDSNLKAGQFKKQIVQQVGKPLDPGKVDESLKQLYRTGRFISLQADTEPQPGGVELIFSGKARYFIGSVRVEGSPRSIGASPLVAATRLSLGQGFTQQELDTAAKNIKSVLADNAYYRSKVTSQVSRHPETQVVDITFTVDPGEPAVLNATQFQSHPAFSDSVLESVTGWKKGRQLTSANIEKGLFKVHNFYLKHGYLQANTTIKDRTFDAKTNTEKLTVESNSGPVIKVRVRGVDISQSNLRNILPVYQDGVVDEAGLRRGAEALQNFYQQKGYFYTSVKAQPVTHPSPDHVLVTYSVERGAQGIFVGYKFEGNRTISNAALSTAMTLQPAGLISSGTFSNKMLAGDISALKGLYQDKGFLNVTITPHLDYNYQKKRDHLFVTLNIAEGPQTRVGDLKFEGVTDKQRKALTPRLENRPGQPYSPEGMQDDRTTILQYFANRGYNQVRIEAGSSTGSKPHVMNIRYSVTPGPQQMIARVVLLGNEHTRGGTVRRQLTVQAGEPLNESEVLDSQRRLYDLGLFNQVQIAPQNPGSPETQKTLLVEMEETRRWTVSYGGGAEVQRLGSNQPQGSLKASPRISLGATRLAVGGRDQTVTFQGRFSSLDKGAQASYLIPRFPSLPDVSLRFDALAESSRNVLTFTARRKEASLILEKRYSPRTFISARYTYRNVQALDLSNRISANEIPLESRAARIGMFAFSYINDHRDDPLDPTRGSYSLVDAGVSSTWVASEANFLRISAQNSTYYRIGHSLILARNTRLAVESPYGGLRRVVIPGPNGVPQIILTHDIPLPERLFMGGSDSHRGFSINQAGPRDANTGFPIGGNALFLNTVELRVPFENGKFGVALFHDAGNVYSSIREMRLLKFHQSSPDDFNYTVHAVGLGLLYKTPVGPLRIDLAYSINPPRFFVTGPTGREVRQLSHFQYFLSIGQSF